MLCFFFFFYVLTKGRQSLQNLVSLNCCTMSAASCGSGLGTESSD